MLEYSVKSLYVNRRYMLVVMGMVYLGLIIALYSFLSCAIGILADAAGSVSEAIVSEVEAFAGEFTVERISDVPELWEKILVILGDKASAASKEIVETLVVMIISIVAVGSGCQSADRRVHKGRKRQPRKRTAADSAFRRGAYGRRYRACGRFYLAFVYPAGFGVCVYYSLSFCQYAGKSAVGQTDVSAQAVHEKDFYG